MKRMICHFGLASGGGSGARFIASLSRCLCGWNGNCRWHRGGCERGCHHLFAGALLSEPREKLLRSQYTGDELVAKIKEARQAAMQDLIDRQLILQAFKKENFASSRSFRRATHARHHSR